MLDTNQSEFIPTFNIYDQIVFAATPANIIMTVCNGNVLYKDGIYKAFDYEIIRKEFSRVLKKIYN